ncbi:Charged multivesicular body protein 4b [Mizuhopecten yessoensis]|uniref:Charged multivesicular body protein 4b n=1 Tax=Mizuhopecten yessoensis TaxID=6573 RepID=A0A210PFE7_MIZYE|nr:Charged multivesicular body protein 4b [Mizuhopecten yessoensis]
MSLFTKMFGGKNKETVTPQQAIQNLSEVQEMLMKKSAFLEKKIEGELATAKKNGTKNKRVALQALKRKKRFEKQLANIDGTLSTIEFQREALENASTNTEVLRVMGFAAKAMKSAHKDMDVDKVHDVMDEIAEQQDVANEISEAISNPVGFGEDDDLLAELEDLEQEQLDEQLLDVGPIGEGLVDLPSVPTAEPKATRKVAVADDDDDMKELAAWAS